MADAGQGTTFSWNGQAIGKIGNLSGPSITNPTVAVTDLDSTWQEYISSAVASGEEMSIDINWEPDDATDHQPIIADCIAGTSRTAIITWNSGTNRTWTFTAFCTTFGDPTASVGESLTASVTFQPSGAITRADV